jgi:endo-1,4-beta-mannosidase
MACLETGKRLRMSTFTLGVNYWPRRSAMYMWERFDPGEIREDFARIRSLGLSVVRFFIMWDDFQPEPQRMDDAMLRHFDVVMNELAAAGLKGMPAFFTGHMSGVNFLPEWVLDKTRTQLRFRTFGRGMKEYPWGAGDFYTQPLLEACRVHVRSIGERARGHEALYMWDLGNEFSNLRGADSPNDSANWARVLTNDLYEVSGGATTAGNHSEDLTDDRGIRPSSFCAPFPCAVMHGYSVYADIARGRLDPDVVPFFCQLMQSMSGKAVLFNEFGNPTCPPHTVSPYDRQPLPGDPLPDAKDLPSNAAPYACLTEDEMATYCANVLDRLHARGALGAFWWNWADYAVELAQTPPFDRAHHEMSFGMIRNDGSFKPVADVLKRFAAENRSVLPPPPPIVRENEWYEHPNDKAYQKAVYEEYLSSYADVHI